MPLAYFGNVAKSFSYSMPSWVAQKLPGTTTYAKMFSKSKREEMRDELAKSRSILKENVFDVLKTGWDKGVEDAKKGNLFGDPDAKFDLSGMGLDLDEGLEGDSFDFDEDQPETSSDKGMPDDVKAIGKMGAAVSGAVGRAAQSIANSPAAQVTAAATEENMRLTRRNMFLNFGALTNIKSQIMVSNDILKGMYNFQIEREQHFYKEALTHYSAMGTMTASIDTKLERLIEASTAIATATDAITRFRSSSSETDFQRVIDADGSFNIVSYMQLLNKRRKESYGEDSMFGMMSRMISGNPFEMIASVVMDSIAGQEGLRAFEKFETFLSDMTFTLTDRFNQWVSSMIFDESTLKNVIGSLLNKFTITLPTFSGTASDLGKYAKSEAVAFDGYAHKALTEVIPSLLGDIHGDTRGMLRVWGGQPEDKKIFDYETGRFSTKSIAMGKMYSGMETSIRSGFSNFASLLRGDDVEGVDDALSALAMSNIINVPRGTKNLDDLFTPIKDQLQSKIELAEAEGDEAAFDTLSKQIENLNKGIGSLQRQASQFSSMEEFLARMNAGMLRARSEFNIHKSRQGSDASMSAFGTAQRDFSEFEEIQNTSDYSNFRDKIKGVFEQQNMFLSPDEIMRRRMDEIEATRLEKMGRKKSAQEIRDRLNAQRGMWSYGFDREAIDDPFGKRNLFTDQEGKFSVGATIQSPFVAASRMFEKTEHQVSKWLFGEKGAKDEEAVGKEAGIEVERKGGLFGGMINRITKAWDDIKNYAMEKIKSAFDKIKETILNPVKEWLLGKGDENGVLYRIRDGFVRIVRENIISPMMNSLRENIINPMKDALFREGGLIDRMKEQIVEPLKNIGNKLAESLWRGEDSLFGQFRMGMGKAFKDLKTSIFGEGAGDKTFMESIGEKFSAVVNKTIDKLGELFKPVGDRLRDLGERIVEKMNFLTNWLTHPETGMIAKATNWIGSHIQKMDEKIFGEGGIINKINDKMNLFFYGDGTDENPGVFKKYLSGIKEFLLAEIWNPLKSVLEEDWKRIKNFFAEELIAPLKGTLQPFIDEFKYSIGAIRDWFAGPFSNTVKDTMKSVGMEFDAFFSQTFGKGIKEMLTENVLDPIREALSSVKEFLGGALKALLKIPVNVIRTLADDLKERQLRRGMTGRMGLGEQARIIRERGIGRSEYDTTSELDEHLRAYDELQERQKGERGKKDRFSWFSNLGKRRPGTSGVATPGDIIKEAVDAATGKMPGGIGASVKDKVKDKTGKFVDDPVVETKDNTKDIKDKAGKLVEFAEKSYNFMRDHLSGAGKNLYKIAKALGADKVLGEDNKEGGRRRGIFGIFSKVGDLLKGMATAPLRTIKAVFDGIMKPVKKVLEMATKTITLPFKVLGKVMSGLGEVVKGATEAFGYLMDGVVRTASVLTNALVEALGTVLKGVSDLATALGGTVKALAEAATTIASTVIKLAATITEGVVKILGDAAINITKVLGSLAKTTIGAIASGAGSFVRAMLGGKKDQALGKLIPVYVVGGYLAGDQGGAKSWVSAKAGAGRMPPMMSDFVNTAKGTAKKNWQFFNKLDKEEEMREEEKEHRENTEEYLKSTAEGVGGITKGLDVLKMILIGGLGLLGAGVVKIVGGLFGLKAASGLMNMAGGIGIGRAAGKGADAVKTAGVAAGASKGKGFIGRTFGKIGTAFGMGAAATAIPEDGVGGTTKTAGNVAKGAAGKAGLLARIPKGVGPGALIAAGLYGAAQLMDDDNPLKGFVEKSGIVLGMASTGALLGAPFAGIGAIPGAIIGGLIGLYLANKKDIDLEKKEGSSAKDIISKKMESGSAVGEKVGSAMGRFVGGAVGAAFGSGIALGKWVSETAEGISTMAINTWESFTGWFKEKGRQIADFVRNIKDLPGILWDTIKNLFGGVVDWASDKSKAIDNFLRNSFLGGIWNWYKDTIGGIIDWFGDKYNKFKSMFEGEGFITNILDKAKDSIRGLFGLFNLCDIVCGVNGDKKPSLEETVNEEISNVKEMNKNRSNVEDSNPIIQKKPAGRFRGYTSNQPNYQSNPEHFDKLSSKYESRGDSSAFGWDRTGGHSYGKYQIAANTGAMGGFLNFLKENDTNTYERLMEAGGEGGAKAGTDRFKSTWKSLAKSKEFQGLEKEYIGTEYYQNLVKKVKGKSDFDIDSRSYALKNVGWSTAVQHGAKHGSGIFDKVLRKIGFDTEDPSLIEGIYKERKTRFGRSTPEVRKAVHNRFDREKKQALDMYAQEQAQVSLVSMGETARTAQNEMPRIPHHSSGMENVIEAAKLGTMSRTGRRAEENNEKIVGSLDENVSETKKVAEASMGIKGALDKIVSMMVEDREEREADEKVIHNPVAARRARRRNRGSNPFIMAEPSRDTEEILRGG